MLKKCGCILTNNEFDIFVKLELLQTVKVWESMKVINKILKTNKKSNYFEQKLLSKVLLKKVFDVSIKRTFVFRAFFKIMRYIKK
jgi:hypothetical protein